jgi:putative addiction module component (TIGR02574 family)
MSNKQKSDALEEIKKLSTQEKILLVEDIWDSIASSDESIKITDEQRKELDSRLES